MGFIKWPQIYAAEAEKLKGGNFNDRKCIKYFGILQNGMKQNFVKTKSFCSKNLSFLTARFQKINGQNFLYYQLIFMTWMKVNKVLQLLSKFFKSF